MISNIKASRLLGYTSLAVGATEIFAAQWLEDQMGVEDHKGLIRAYGVREIGAGGAILRQPGISAGLATALWARVAGDVLDIGTLCAAATVTRKRSGLMTIAAIVIAITGLDILIASLVQHNVVSGRHISLAARDRVTPTNAIPAIAVTPEEPSAVEHLEEPVSLGNG